MRNRNIAEYQKPCKMHDRVKIEVVATYIRERLLRILFKLDKKDLYNVQTHNSSIALRLTIVS